MAKFLTNLLINQMTDSVFELVAPLVYESDLLECTIAVPQGFQSDGASVPRVPIAYMLFGNRAHREAVLHDAMFCIDFPGNISFSTANNVFLEAMTVRGKPFYVRYPIYFGVCMGAWPYFHKRKLMDQLSKND